MGLGRRLEGLGSKKGGGRGMRKRAVEGIGRWSRQDQISLCMSCLIGAHQSIAFLVCLAQIRASRSQCLGECPEAIHSTLGRWVVAHIPLLDIELPGRLHALHSHRHHLPHPFSPRLLLHFTQ